MVMRFIGLLNIVNYDFFSQIGLKVKKYTFSPLVLTFILLEGLYTTLVDGFIMSAYINNQYNNTIYNLAISVVVFQSISIIIVTKYELEEKEHLKQNAQLDDARLKQNAKLDDARLKQNAKLHEQHLKQMAKLDEEHLKQMAKLDEEREEYLKRMEEIDGI
jgi:mannitol-specific phosphotransferase system IIBC component